MINEQQDLFKIEDTPKGIFSQEEDEFALGVQSRQQELIRTSLDADSAKSHPLIGLDDIFENKEAERHIERDVGRYDDLIDLDGSIALETEKEREELEMKNPDQDFSTYQSNFEKRIYGSGTSDMDVIREQREIGRASCRERV